MFSPKPNTTPTDSELLTPVGQLIKAATDPVLLGPDWSQNLDICDQINNLRDGPEQAIRAISKRLKDSNTTTVFLTLIVMETCIKNCGMNFTKLVDKNLMNDIVNISKGISTSADEALRLVQQWGRAFENRRDVQPIFYDTYCLLKSKGIKFPKEEDNSSIIFESEKRPSISVAPAQASTISDIVEITNEEEFANLESDLVAVIEKNDLCVEMLQFSPGIEQDELLADVIGFLEACRDRLSDVIVAGTQGLLSEELFEKVLKVNDAVIKTLEAERYGSKITVEKEGGEKKENNVDLLDFDSNDNKKSTNDLDLFSPSNVNNNTINNDHNNINSNNNNNNDVFDNNDFISPPPVPESSVTLPPPIPESSGTLPPPVSNSSVTGNQLPPPSTPMTDSDFDAFFESLGKTN